MGRNLPSCLLHRHQAVWLKSMTVLFFMLVDHPSTQNPICMMWRGICGQELATCQIPVASMDVEASILRMNLQTEKSSLQEATIHQMIVLRSTIWKKTHGHLAMTYHMDCLEPKVFHMGILLSWSVEQDGLMYLPLMPS